MPRRLRTQRDLLTLLAGAAELAVCPGCTDHGAWEQLAGDADALYAPDGATIVARVETNWCAASAVLASEYAGSQPATADSVAYLEHEDVLVSGRLNGEAAVQRSHVHP